MKRLLVAALATASIAAAPALARAADTPLKVVPIGLGTVHVEPAPNASIDANGGSCDALPDLAGSRVNLAGACTLFYPSGTPVTLTAAGGDDGDGPPTVFRRWSDDRCPAATSCTHTVGPEAETIAALFSPQRVTVVLNGATGSVTSSVGQLVQGQDAGCTADNGSECTGDFDLDLPAPVELRVASDPPPTWLQDPQRLLCDAIATGQMACSVTPGWPRWASVGFGVPPAETAVPPDISVDFRVNKAGGGSGTVRGEHLDCGTACSANRTFGASETLQAVPDGDSRFAGWRGACGAAATCRLAVGPVTAITAIFERTAGSSPPPGGGPQGRSLDARIVKLNVRGHGRKRTIMIRLDLSAAASVRAQLLRGRHQLTARRWQLQAGSRLLRLRVPRRVRAGSYVLRLTVSGGGQTKQMTRRVGLRR